MTEYMSISEAVTLAIALLGAVLGVINILIELNRDRVRLKVIPKGAFCVPSTGEEHRICIEVRNLSGFPVTISEVGFVLHDTRRRAMVISPMTADGKSLPRRLEPHNSVSTYTAPIDQMDIDLSKVKCAYAKTDCDIIKRGNSPALKRFVREARNLGDTSE
jgi:hypothetical protein